MQQFNGIGPSNWSNAVFSGKRYRNEPVASGTQLRADQWVCACGSRKLQLAAGVVPLSTRSLKLPRLRTPGVTPSAMWRRQIPPGSANQEIQTYSGDSSLDKRQQQTSTVRISSWQTRFTICRSLPPPTTSSSKPVGAWGGQRDRRRGPRQLPWTVFSKRGLHDSFKLGADQSAHRYRLRRQHTRPLVTGQKFNGGEKTNHVGNAGAFTLVGYALEPFPKKHRNTAASATALQPRTGTRKLAKNWMVKEKYRIKFAMDFFDFLNHPNFNSGGMEGRDTRPA